MTTKQELIELQETLYQSKNPTRRWLHCIRRDWIIDKLYDYSKNNNSTVNSSLEIGPGSGIYLPILSNISTAVLGIDIERAYLNNARKFQREYKNLSLQVDDIINSRLPSHSFDLILCTEVIEHIVKSEIAIKQMHRLLKPGGILLLSTPQRYSPLEVVSKIAFLPIIIQLVRFIYQEPILESGHINLMTEKQVTNQIKSAGFEIIEKHKTGIYLPFIAEFFGQSGLSLEKFIEKKIYGSVFDWLLWTQYYVAKA